MKSEKCLENQTTQSSSLWVNCTLSRCIVGLNECPETSALGFWPLVGIPVYRDQGMMSDTSSETSGSD